MSNRQVAAVYRSIIDDVVEKATVDFDEAGVQIEVLHELQRSWEAKVASSRVADFTQDLRMGAIAQSFPMMPSESSAGGQPPASASASGPVASTSASAAVVAKGEEDEDEKAKKASAAAENGATSTVVTPIKPKPDANDDEINSDLDDSDEDGDNDDDDAGAGQGGDLVIALYEKVQRVKNKWKVTLKDGLVSVNGKDYLFAKCNGEFEF